MTLRDIDTLYMNQTKELIRAPNFKKVDKALNRSEFVDLLLRISIKKYYLKIFNGSIVQSRRAAVEIFMGNDFSPIIEAGKYEYDNYRRRRVYQVLIDNILFTNQTALIEIYDNYKSNESFLTLKGLVLLLNDKNIEINEEEILKCFVLSKMLLTVEVNIGPSKSFHYSFLNKILREL